MSRKRPRPRDQDSREHEEERECNASKRRKRTAMDGDHLLWPPRTFNLTYLVWASRQFPSTGYCIDFRAQWIKSRYGCPLCDKYDVRKAGDIDSLCKTDTTRTEVLDKFPATLSTETLESVEYLMCSRPHGARSFAYELGGKDDAKVRVEFQGIHHLGWPELSALLQMDLFLDVTIDMSEQRASFTLAPKSITLPAAEEVAIAVVGYYLRLDHPGANRITHAAV